MSASPPDQDHVPAKPDSPNSSKKAVRDKELSETNVAQKTLRFLNRITIVLTQYGVETHGISPIPATQRIDTRWYQIFFFWFSSFLNILTFALGTAGPAFFSLGIRDSIVVIVVTTIVASLFPAFFVVFGPKLGMRAMIQSRFSWGYYGSIIPCVLNALSMQGYLILNTIVGGQMLVSLSSHLSDTLGIVIISLVTLVVAFSGCKFLYWYESIVWLPSVITFIAMLAIGYPELHANQFVEVSAPTTSSVLSFASIIAAAIVSCCPIASDYGVYHSPSASSTRIFIYAYLGLVISCIICLILGAAFAAAAPNVPAWSAAFKDSTSAGGLLYGVLMPLGGFGKLLTVLMALTTPSACVPTMYSFSTSFMSVAHCFTLIPRWVYILVSEAILVPVAIVGANKFYTTFVDMLDIIGYWTAAYTGIVLAEHVFFRRKLTETSYPAEAWASPELLPRSIPAVLAFLCAFGALIPFMSQAWYVGPVARAGSGDCGVYVGFMVALVAYVALRGLERWWDRGRKTRDEKMGEVEADGPNSV